MRFFTLLVFIYSFCCYASAPSPTGDDIIERIERYDLLSDPALDPLPLAHQGGEGSGLTYVTTKEDGTLVLYSITDRGPNTGGPNLPDGRETLILMNAPFTPLINKIEVAPGRGARIVERIPLKNADGSPMNGFPVTHEGADFIGITTNWDVIPPKIDGVDSEAIAVAPNGDIWVGDEYHPSLLHYTPKGELIERIIPGEGLPLMLLNRQRNRGIEALTILPNGHLFFSTEGMLNLEDATINEGLFMRLFEFDPVSRRVIRSLAYPHENDYVEASRSKIGDMEAINNHSALLVEQVKDKDKQLRNRIFHIDWADATDIQALTLPNGKPLEYATSEGLTSLQLVRKTALFNARDYGWTSEKLEGLAIIDPYTIAIIDDNDFGDWVYESSYNGAPIRMYHCDMTPERGLTYKGTPIPNDFVVTRRHTTPTQLWVIRLSKPIPGVTER